MLYIFRGLVRSVAVVFATPFLTFSASAQMSPPPPAPNPMVWEQGIADNPQWRQLGCPHGYANDLEKERMIRDGLCKNANLDGTVKNPASAQDAKTATWKVLGCPRDYESDADLEDMKRAELCKNATTRAEQN